MVSIGTVGALNGWFGGGSSIPSDTMTRGLVGYWSFDEGNGTTTFDSSGNNNDGQFLTASSSPKWISGKVSSALQFDGVDDYVSVGDVGSVQTVEFWLNDSNTTDGILELVDNTTYISISGSAISLTGFTSTTTYVNGVETSSLSSGWNHVAIIADAVSAASVNIGEANSDYMDGIIDEVRLYDRALSAEEVRYHYNRGGPVAHWTFDEGNGTTTYDSTDNGNDGIFVTAETSPIWTTGKHGTGLLFDGENDYVNLPDIGVPEKITITAWIKVNTYFGSSYFYGIVGTPSPGNGYMMIRLGNDGTEAGKDLFDFAFYNGSSYSEIYGTTHLATGIWYHVVATYDGSYMRTYVNGIQESSQVDDGPTTSGQNLIIGADLLDNRYFDGIIDDVRIYNYARTPDEIALDYNAGFAARFGPQSSCDDDPGACMEQGLVGYWGFEEGSGYYVYDNSEYGNTGTLGGYADATSSDPKWTTGIKSLSGGVFGGNALQFDGKDDYVVTGSDVPSVASGGKFSIEVWTKPEDVAY